MASLWNRLALSLVLLSIFHGQLLLVCADYEVRVAVHSYRNPSHMHAGGGCCDALCADCDNYFLFCLRTPGAAQSCSLGELHSGVVGGDSLTFNPVVGGSFGRLSNPLRFMNTGNWTGSFQLVIEVNDDDAGLSQDEFVDSITITRSLAVGDSFTGVEAYSGENGRSTIVLSFLVACVENFYGPDCGTLCVPQDHSTAHYTCDSQGNRVCLEGYHDPALNCTRCLPSEGCLIGACGQVNPCQNGGSCETGALGDISCSCALGFMGPSCEVSVVETTPTDNETPPTDALMDDPIPSIPGGSSNQRSTSGPGAGVLAAAVAVPLLVVLLSVAVIVTLVLVCLRHRKKWRFSGGGGSGQSDTMDIKPNPVYGVSLQQTPLAPGGVSDQSDTMDIKPNPVYGVSLQQTPQTPGALEYYVIEEMGSQDYVYDYVQEASAGTATIPTNSNPPIPLIENPAYDIHVHS